MKIKLLGPGAAYTKGGTLKRLFKALSLPLVILITGCTININVPSFSRSPRDRSNRVEVELDKNGVVDSQLLKADPPQILRPGKELFLITKETAFAFDVTFVLLVPLPEVRPRVAQGTTSEQLSARFEEFLESQPNVLEAKCRVLPRCEVTFEVPKARDAKAPGELRVPSALLELDAASATPFQILRIESGLPPTPEDRVYVKVPKRIGFITTERKPASARLKVPLDNTGIADWGFLNPRLPKVLSGGVFEPASESSSQGASQGESAKSAIDHLKRLAPDPGPSDTPRTSIPIRDLAIAAIQQVDQVARLKTSDRDAKQTQEFANSAISAVMRTADGVIRSWETITSEAPKMPDIEPASDTCPHPKPKLKPGLEESKKEFDVQEEADRVRDLAVSEICITARDSIASLPADRPEWEVAAVLTISRFAIEAFGSAARITPEMDVPITDASKDADKKRIQGAATLIDSILKEDRERRNAISAVGGEVDSKFQKTLIDVIETQASASLASLKVEADRAASALNAEIQEITLQRQRVRFSNETVDRYFVITLDVSRRKLLDAFADPRCPAGKDQDACELRLIQAERYDNSIDLTISGDANVTVTLTVPPGSPGEIDAWLLSKAPKDIVPFNVDFFDQTDDPAFSKGYIALREIDPADSSVQPDSRFVSNLITGLTTFYEPCLGGTECGGSLNQSVPYDGELKRHSKGRGQLDLSQNLGNRADSKLSLLYEYNDLGQTEVEGASDPVRVSQFQVNVFGTTGLTMSLGKFTFAEPSNRIAISEAGEGLRLTWRHLAVSYITKRESNLGTTNDHDKDRDTWLGEVSGPFRGTTPFRRFRLFGLWGEDRCKPQRLSTPPGPGVPGSVINGECKDVDSFPYTYATVGGEVFFNARADRTPQDLLAGRSPWTGSLAGYASRKDARLAGKPDGEGYVGLFTLGRPHDWVPEKPGSKKLKPRRIFTALLGYGSGDEAESGDVDEGYIGEGAAFTNDMVFLGSLAGAIRKGSLKQPETDLTQLERRRIGVGLSNKWYQGLQYTINDTSPLEWVAIHVFRGLRQDIVSQSSTFSAHRYEFVEPIFGDSEAGYELDTEFRIEQPQHVKWRMNVGYFIPGDALKSLVKRETWSASLSVVIEPAKLF